MSEKATKIETYKGSEEHLEVDERGVSIRSVSFHSRRVG